jgi:hypothetical protein
MNFHMAGPRLNAIMTPTRVPVCAVRLMVQPTPLPHPGTDSVRADNPARPNRSTRNKDFFIANPNDRRLPKKANAQALRFLQKHLMKHNSADTYSECPGEVGFRARVAFPEVESVERKSIGSA